jgi:hypothetical protein
MRYCFLMSPIRSSLRNSVIGRWIPANRGFMKSGSLPLDYTVTLISVQVRFPEVVISNKQIIIDTTGGRHGRLSAVLLPERQVLKSTMLISCRVIQAILLSVPDDIHIIGKGLIHFNWICIRTITDFPNIFGIAYFMELVTGCPFFTCGFAPDYPF